MGVVAKDDGGKNFAPCPEGLHQAVCVDIVDMGEMDNKFNAGKKQHKARIVWQVDVENHENKNKPFEVSRLYTVSLNEKASLRKDLEGWRGRKFTADELKGFDLDVLIGVNCQVNVVHFTNLEGKTYGNVQTIVPISKNMERIKAREYVRVQDRDPKDQVDGQSANGEDDDIPF